MTGRIRRDRGTPTVGVHMFLAPDVKQLLDRYVDATQLPQWAIVEAAIRSVKPNDFPTEGANRRKRGTTTVGVHMFLAPDVKQLIDHHVETSKLPQWAIVETAIRAGQSARATRIPTDWDLPTINTHQSEDNEPELFSMTA